MAGNWRSGRRKEYPNLELTIAKLAETSVRTIADIRDNPDAALATRLDAAKYLVDRHMGKPRQSTELSAEVSTTPISRVEYHLDTGDNGHRKEGEDAIQDERSEAGSPETKTDEVPQ